MAVIEAEGLVKIYRSRKDEVRALDGVDLEVEEGTVLGLLGPNGAGKTTTVRILSTLLRSDAGSARIAGLDIARDAQAVRKLIGLSGQYAAVDENLTGRENLWMFGRLYQLGSADAKQRAAELLTSVDLEGAADRVTKTYSGGMRRRLDLASALIGRPQLLFLDEPTTGLDPRSRLGMWEVIRNQVRQGTTLLLTTQYLEEADVLADRVGIIDHGTLVAEGTPAELKAEIGRSTVEAAPADPARAGDLAATLGRFGEETQGSPGTVAVRLDGVGDLADIVRTLDAEGLKVENLRLHAPSLDDVFLAKTGRSLEGAQEEAEREAEPVEAE
jgi:ABC-2 type transport system ATP-binding protein